MSDFDRTIDKAIAELNAARHAGPCNSALFLAQARYHVNLAIDYSKQAKEQDTPLAVLPTQGDTK